MSILRYVVVAFGLFGLGLGSVAVRAGETHPTPPFSVAAQQAAVCHPQPPITGSFVNSCADCTLDASCNTMTCYCDRRRNKTSISLAVCPTHHFCNAGGYLECGEGCRGP